MAQIVKLRRSSVSGQKPTNSNLQLGELALNTTDGKVYMAVSGSLGPSVEELISTNTVNTGSVNVSGSINLTGSLTTTKTLSGSILHIVSGYQPQLQLKNTTTGNEYHIGTGGLGLLSFHTGDGTAIAYFSTSSVHFNEDVEVTGSVRATEFTGSALGLTNVPFQISGSDLGGNTYNKQFTKLQFDDSTGLNVSESVPGTAFISIGSHFKDIFVSGSPILSATGSDAFEVIPTGGVEITTSITDTNGNGYVKELNISTTTLSSSLNYRMDTITGSITTLSSSLDSRINTLNTFTSSVVLTSQTSSMNVLSASYALTAAFALNAGAGGGNGSITDGAYAVLNQTTPATTWTFKHSLGQRYPIFQVFDSNGVVILPSQITTIDVNNATITFPSNQTGKVIASLGTGPGGLSQYFSSSTIWSLAHNLGSDYPIVTIWDSNRNIIFPQRIESVDTNNIKIYFSAPVAGYVNVAKGGHIISGSVGAGSIDFTDTNIVSGSAQILITGTTGYSTFSGSISSSIGSLSSSVATTTLGLSSSIVSLSSSVALTTSGLTSTITTLSSSLSSSIDYLSSSVATTTNNLSSSLSGSIGSLSSSIASIDNTQNGRLDSLETASGSIRTDFNSFTSSYTTVSGSLDSRLDVLEAYSGSQLVPSSSMSFRTLETSVYCKNVTGTQINKGTVVRIVGSVGDNPLIAPAGLLTEGESANTLGFAIQNIPNDDFGMVITEGILIGVNTSGMTAGDLLYLGANGTFTTNPPAAPNHGVRLGEVLRVQQNQGSIYVRVDNGIELNEAHDVIYTGITHGDLLVRSGSIWKNSKSLEGNYVVTGSLTISQNLTVLGSSSLVYVTSSQLAVSASTISVNVFEPAERFGGLKVYDSGSSSATASLLWDSLHNHWVYQNVSGSNYSGGMLLSGPRNTGSLGDEPTLINGRIAKSVGGDHLDNSIISETGTTITIAGDLVANSITGAFDYFGLVNRPTLVSGSSQIDITGTTNYTTFSSSVSTSIGSLSSSVATTTVNLKNRIDSIEGITGSISSLNSFTSSINTTIKSKLDSEGVISGSIQVIYSGLTGIPSGIVSGSEQLTGSYDTRYILSGSITQTTWDNIASKPSGIVSGSEQIIYSGLTGIPSGIVSSSSQIIYSGLTGIPSGIVSGSSQLTGSYDSRYVLSGSITQTTWDNIGSKPSGIISGSVQIVNLGFATTSSNDLYGDRYLFSTALSTGSWVINHNLGFQFPNVDIYDSSNQILIPQAITATSTNSMQIDFATPTIGKAILTIGGARSTGLFVQSGSFYNATTNIGITGSLVVTGDVDADNFNTTSDRKLKTNLVRIENALDKIEKLNGYTFDWLEEYSEDRTRQIGMVADEVYEVQPELISHRNIVLSNKEEKIKLLDYSKVTAILIEAIKELNDKVTKLENKKKKK